VSAYFSDASLGFLTRLAAHNNKTWFNEHKREYEQVLRLPFQQLIADLQPDIEAISPHFRADPRTVGGSLYRIQRDARYSHDKSPYKTWQGARFYHERRRLQIVPLFYLHLQPGGCFLGAGLWHPEPESMRKVRQFIFDNPASWKAAAHSKAITSRFELDPNEKLVRAPRGYPAEHELIEDLKHRNWVYWRSLDDSDITSASLRATLVKDYTTLAPFVDYLCAALDLEF
jgi:uncharacterized protein (TIGR02453 family)